MAILVLTAVLGALIALFAWLGRLSRKRLLATIRVVTLPDVTASAWGNSRDITIYLPRDYATRNRQCYPALYVNDGQDRDEFHLHETLARLQARGEMLPAIVVAVPTNDNRLREYGTAVAPNGQGLGDRAGDYAAFLADDLMPLIDDHFRTCGRALICGVSLGGLSAFDIAWNDPVRFSTVGVFSGSFWWRSAENETAVPPGERIAHAMVRQDARHVDQRFWFEVGTRDETSDRDGNGVIDAIQDTTELIDELAAAGYETGLDIAYLEVTGGRHNYETWSSVLPDFLRWALGPGTAVEGRGN